MSHMNQALIALAQLQQRARDGDRRAIKTLEFGNRYGGPLRIKGQDTRPVWNPTEGDNT